MEQISLSFTGIFTVYQQYYILLYILYTFFLCCYSHCVYHISFCNPQKEVIKNIKPIKGFTFSRNWLFLNFYYIEVGKTVGILDPIKFY